MDQNRPLLAEVLVQHCTPSAVLPPPLHRKNPKRKEFEGRSLTGLTCLYAGIHVLSLLLMGLIILCVGIIYVFDLLLSKASFHGNGGR